MVKLLNIKFYYLLMICVVFFSCSAQKGEFNISEEITYKVVRIVDGDTYVLEDNNGVTEKIRLIGADTPETKHPKKGKEPFGPEATEFAKRYLEDKNVELKFEKGKKDRYKRILAHVYIGNIHFNKMLIDSGMAKTMFYPPNFAFVGLFEKSEEIAKHSRLGIWGDLKQK